MKAALFVSLIATAAATAGPTTRNCVIPGDYTVSSGTTCNGAVTGYLVYGVCVPLADRAAYTYTGPTTVKELMVAGTGGNTLAFSSGGTTMATASTRPGCVVPSPFSAWGSTFNVANDQTQAALTTAVACQEQPTQNANAAAINPSLLAVKGVAIECDRNAGYYPINGHEGTNICVNAYLTDTNVAAGPAGIWPLSTTQTMDFLASPSILAALPNATSTSALNNGGFAQFSGPERLLCAKGCTLPASICNNGRLNANVVGTGVGFMPGTCFLLPNATNSANWLRFTCATGLGRGTAFTATCTTDITATTIAAPALVYSPANFNFQCGVQDGAQSVPLWNNNGNLNGWDSPITQAAGLITNFPSVVSILSIAYPVTTGAYFTPWGRRHWNNNGAQNLVNGNVYNIAVAGCNSSATFVLRTQCVQQTLNWWRCNYNFPFNGGTLCYADYTAIACPTHALGFRCPSSSKKGLLGLLGLLGLIPLLLLCCCLLFLCCIRRRKTEADVHFATFDPHAAPVIATAPCATATACPTAFGATPFATHPSAIPCL